jgi:periplasmic divalent cation tolerance protein
MSDAAAIATVYAVFADEAEARRIGRAMVEEKLAACVNILGPCRSIYRWQGAIEDAAEVPVLFKTPADTAERLIERIAALHGYEVPAIVQWPIERAFVPYADWVKESVRRGEA